MKKNRVPKLLVLLIALLVFVLLLITPPLSKNYINKHGKELSGRGLHIQKLRYNYFSSTVKVIGFSMFESDDSTEFVGFDSLTINLKPLRLFKDELHIQQLLLVNPRGQVIQTDSIFNFSDLLVMDVDSVAEDDESHEIGYNLNLNQLEMRSGNFMYTDALLDHSIHLRAISFKIPQIFWQTNDSSKAGLEFELAEGGHFASSVNYQVSTGHFHGAIDLSRVALHTFLPYMQEYLKFSGVNGHFDTHLSFSGSSENTDDFLLTGTATGNNMEFIDETGKKVLGAKKVSVDLKKILPMQESYELDKMVLDNPYIYFTLVDSLTNFDLMLVEDSALVDSVEFDEEESIMNFQLNQLLVHNGLLDFSDQRYSNEFTYELSEVEMNMDTLEYVDDWVNLQATMKLNKRGKLDATLGLNPVNYMDSMQLEYVITDFQLPDLNIYSKHYVGLPILFGDMYYVSKTSLVNKQLESENELIVRNVDMGRKTGGLYDIPIKLALFILKDINGDITLNVPVKGDFEDPKTKIGPIVFNTLKNFMFKIVASPFKALGSALGANSDEISHLDFSYSDTTLSAKQTKTLDLLLELELKKPELQTDLIYLNDKTLERLDAAREIAHKMYKKETGRNADANLKRYLEFLEQTTGKDSLVIQDYEILIAPDAEIDSTITNREIKRIEMVTSYLYNQNDSTSIRLKEYNPKEVLNKGSRPHFKVKVNLAEEID